MVVLLRLLSTVVDAERGLLGYAKQSTDASA